jgi:hypothetical protein
MCPERTLYEVATPAGFEPATFSLEDCGQAFHGISSTGQKAP